MLCICLSSFVFFHSEVPYIFFYIIVFQCVIYKREYNVICLFLYYEVHSWQDTLKVNVPSSFWAWRKISKNNDCIPSPFDFFKNNCLYISFHICLIYKNSPRGCFRAVKWLFWSKFNKLFPQILLMNTSGVPQMRNCLQFSKQSVVLEKNRDFDWTTKNK